MMRAVTATGPKVLRIGVSHRGRVVEERIVRQRTDVTVGASEKAMFSLAAPGLPAVFRLFQRVGKDYCLNVLDGMSGRVALPTGVSELEVLRGRARRTSQGAAQIRLTEDSRGRVVIGEWTLLFQFVAPPPVQPRAQLPVSVMRGASGIDWPTTMIAAISFLLHFMAIGAVYSDWLDPIVDDEVSVASVIDSVKALPPPPPVEEQETPEEVAVAESSREASAKAPASVKGAGPASRGPMSAAQAAALSSDLDKLEMDTLGALVGEGPATAGVLMGGEVPTGALDQAAASGAGVGFGGIGGLNLGGGGGPMRPGSVGGGLDRIGTTGQTAGTQGSGKTQTVKGPTGNASVGGVSGSGNVSDASRVVAQMRGGFRACYQRELANNPDAEGTIRLTIRVGPGGEVLSVAAASTGNLGSAVACVRARASAAQFAPPEGGSAVVTVPVTFVKQ